ncbi:MAG: tryptophan 23-dioxygenase [Acidimicrobiaceae bacterium]|nr:tryptophan 23-dioxygenase [Acidimicrobiaceae bacterium]
MAKKTDYSTYLRINDLLKLQIPLTHGAADELLFIVVHQSYELWFKVMIDELAHASSVLHANEPWRALAHLKRVVEIEELLLTHLRLLDTMSPEGFLAFRDPLDPASGFQSFQFRAIEFLSGGGTTAVLGYDFFDDEQRARLKEISERPHVWSGFEHSLRTTLSTSAQDDLLDLLRALYHDHASAQLTSLHAVAELLMDHDENLALWRYQHLLMAGRQIGRRPGTGGSEGMAFLDTTLSQRLYPVLWEVRSVL